MKLLQSVIDFNIYSFRARIAVALILTLIVTTGVLYRLNQRAEQLIITDVEAQRGELASAINVAQQSLTSTQYVREFLKNERERNNSEETHIKRILVVGSQGKVEDSSDAYDIGKNFTELGFGTFEQAIDLSRKQSLGKLPKQDILYTFPIQTRSGVDLDNPSLIYIIIVFADDLGEHLQTSSMNRLLATGGMLLGAVIITLILIVEFTRPVGRLVSGAQKVAAGDFDINLPVKRPDELGRLTTVFNDMVRGLRERRELEARLFRAEQSAIVGRLASGIAHEVKNPLNYISLTIDYLRGKFAPAAEDAKERYFDKMDGIKDEIKRLDRLIRNFLSYGRPLELNLKPIQLREMIDGIIKLTADQAEQQSLKVTVDEESSLPVIEVDIERMKSCFSNLIINAQQAMAEGGQLHISLCRQDEGVKAAIADTGSGIAPENLSKIFEPYFSTKDTGTGLGLALVKRIVEAHGGRITVESSVGVGTTFQIWLPIHPPKQAEQLSDKLHTNTMEQLPV